MVNRCRVLAGLVGGLPCRGISRKSWCRTGRRKISVKHYVYAIISNIFSDAFFKKNYLCLRHREAYGTAERGIVLLTLGCFCCSSCCLSTFSRSDSVAVKRGGGRNLRRDCGGHRGVGRRRLVRGPNVLHCAGVERQLQSGEIRILICSKAGKLFAKESLRFKFKSLGQSPW